MSTTTKHYFFVYAPDKTDDGALARRLAIRPSHLENAKELRANGVLRFGGPLLVPDAFTSANINGEKKYVGSTFVCEAESIEEVKKLVESDVYYTTGVWDPEKLVIFPFISTYPLP